MFQELNQLVENAIEIFEVMWPCVQPSGVQSRKMRSVANELVGVLAPK